jgi:hypothetical protein
MDFDSVGGVAGLAGGLCRPGLGGSLDDIYSDTSVPTPIQNVISLASCK